MIGKDSEAPDIPRTEKPVIVIGHAALDHLYRIAEFPEKPAKVRALEHIESGGGMAANAAAAIARLGGRAVLWSRVGADDAGRKILALLEADGVDTTSVLTHEGARSSTAAVIVDGQGERLIVGERDHAMPVTADWLPLGNIAHAGAVLSDLRWLEGTMAGLERARALGVPTLLDVDVGGAEQLDAFLALTDYAIFSAAALEHFESGGDDRARLAKVLGFGVKHAGVTRGGGGYTWMRSDGAGGHQPAFTVDVVDTTGAGDAFHGAFAWALATGRADAACARIAAAASAIKCRALGARQGLPARDELFAFLK